MDFYGDRKVYMYEIEQNKTRITDFYEQVTKISKIKPNVSLQNVKFVQIIDCPPYVSLKIRHEIASFFICRCNTCPFFVQYLYKMHHFVP